MRLECAGPWLGLCASCMGYPCGQLGPCPPVHDVSTAAAQMEVQQAHVIVGTIGVCTGVY